MIGRVESVGGVRDGLGFEGQPCIAMKYPIDSSAAFEPAESVQRALRAARFLGCLPRIFQFRGEHGMDLSIRGGVEIGGQEERKPAGSSAIFCKIARAD